MSRGAAEGLLDLSAPKKMEYRFDSRPLFSPPASIVLEYRFDVLPESADRRLTPIFETGGESWALPLPAGGETLHYAIPVDNTFTGYFSVSINDGADKQAAGKTGRQILRLCSVEIRDRWYGFYRQRNGLEDHVYTSPFVDIRREENGISLRLFDSREANPAVPDDYFPVLTADFGRGREVILEAGSLRFEPLSGEEKLNIPVGMIAPGVKPVTLR